MKTDAQAIKRLFGIGDIAVSFEFFPPKTDRAENALWRTIERLSPLNPDFVSVPYGAGGSTRERTHRTVSRLLRETGLKPAAHLTCVGAPRQEIDEIVQAYWDIGVRHIVALRGDPPEGIGSRYQPFPGGYVNAADLTAGIRKVGDFEISVSAYPEKHPESGSWDVEIDNLKRKVDNGATRAITQFFFDNDVFEAFLERVRAAGITIPIVPGILPVQNFALTSKFAAQAGASVPDWMVRCFEGLDEDPHTRELVGAALAVEQVSDLIERGVHEVHFYTMNRADLVYAVCRAIGVDAEVAAPANPAEPVA